MKKSMRRQAKGEMVLTMSQTVPRKVFSELELESVATPRGVTLLGVMEETGEFVGTVLSAGWEGLAEESGVLSEEELEVADELLGDAERVAVEPL